MLILASASPRRKELLDAAGIAVEIVPSTTDETVRKNEEPRAVVERLSLQKALDVSLSHPERVVLAADTVVALPIERGSWKILGKPDNRAHARQILELLSNQEHSVWSGVSVVLGQAKKQSTISVETKVSFQRLNKARIEWYIESDEPLDKAGAYAIQGRGGSMIDSIQGSYTNVIGLPLTETLKLLEVYGIK